MAKSGVPVFRKTFDRDGYQQNYMATRREADVAGFGGSRDPESPKFNPKYKTVAQYLAWKSGRKVAT